jgi:hypothetical protein
MKRNKSRYPKATRIHTGRCRMTKAIQQTDLATSKQSIKGVSALGNTYSPAALASNSSRKVHMILTHYKSHAQFPVGTSEERSRVREHAEATSHRVRMYRMMGFPRCPQLSTLA